MRKSLRYLRITWTVFCGIACVLLIVLWVRSYMMKDELFYRTSMHWGVKVSTFRGGLYVLRYKLSADFGLTPGELDRRWTSVSIEDYLHQHRVQLPPQPTFRFKNLDNYGWSIVSPIWFWLLTITSFAALVLKYAKWRFSLRTLLVAVALVAIGLSLIVYAIKSAH